MGVDFCPFLASELPVLVLDFRGDDVGAPGLVEVLNVTEDFLLGDDPTISFWTFVGDRRVAIPGPFLCDDLLGEEEGDPACAPVPSLNLWDGGVDGLLNIFLDLLDWRLKHKSRNYRLNL